MSVYYSYFAARQQSASVPILLFTDIVSGSVTNGEGGAGAYLTLYGLNFGSAANMGTAAGAQVTIGGAAVANYRYLVNSKTWGLRPGFPNISALCVQIGSAAVQALTAGSTYAIGLTVNGVAANTNDLLGNAFNFTIQPGHFWFVDTVNGSDSTGVVDDITHPYRFIQQANGGTTFTGIWASLAAGDTIVIRGNSGTAITDQTGFDGRLMRFRTQGGTAPNGTIGNGYIHFTSYPGAIGGNAPDDVFILTPSGGKGGFMGTDTVHARPNANAGQYWSCSNMRSSCASSLGSTDASNFNLQNSADFTRFVNLDVTWPSTDTGLAHQKAGGIVGNGFHVKIFGCYVHDISGGDPSSLENHGLYMDGSNTDAAFVEMGFNVILNCTTGQCIQYHQEASTGFHDCYTHHNWSENSAKYAMKMDGWSGLMWWWNNVAVGSVREGMQVDATGATSSGVVRFENNTLYDCYSSATGSTLAEIGNAGGTAPGTFTVNNNVFAFGPGTSGFSAGFVGSVAGMTFNGNLYFDYSGRLTTGYSGDPGRTYADPKFNNTATFPNFDARIGATSAALGIAVAATINPVNDLAMNVQPRSGQSINSVGAFA